MRPPTMDARASTSIRLTSVAEAGHDVVKPAARLVRLVAHPANDDERRVGARRLPVDEALGASGGLAAHHADRGELRHLVGEREEAWHRPEGDAAEVPVEAGDDDLLPELGEPLDDLRKTLVEELALLDGDDVRIGDGLLDFGRGVDGDGPMLRARA